MSTTGFVTGGWRRHRVRLVGHTRAVPDDDALYRLVRQPPPLPVVEGIPALVRAVASAGTAVLQAPPGTGKTTLVPPALAIDRPGRVLVAQPRPLPPRPPPPRPAPPPGGPRRAAAGDAGPGGRRARPP